MLFRILLFILPISCFAQSSLNVMTFNIRYATPNDGINQWENRKEHVAETITYYNTDICGLQEATEPQVLFLGSVLKDYKWVGVGRDDGKAAGEFAPIFYNPSKLTLTSWKTVWLSKTPEKPSKDWDAALPRIATVAHFTRKEDGKAFVAINTHYDHRGTVARVESSKLLLKLIANIKEPVVLMGDFNSTPSDGPILTYTDGGLDNSQDISEEEHYGPINTFTGFKPQERENSQIDHIFVNNEIQVLKHATISQTWDGRFASDHHPILAKLKF